MNRNTQAHFAETPSLNISRSKFDRSFTHKTTFNTGFLVPYFCCDVIPGDTMKMNTAHVVRMMTPVAPVMDNANLDTYFFFVPNRLIWEHWQEFMGENKTAPWIQQTQYQIPQIESPATTGWTKGSLADYFGYPTGVPGYKADAMPFRAYALIYNEWFRDENLCNPLYIHEGDADITGVDITDPNLNPITDIEKGACCAKAAKYPDYFTMALPNAQKGPAVKIPLGNSAPIIGTNNVGSQAGTIDTRLIGEELYIKNNSSQQAMIRTVDNDTGLQPSQSIGLAVDLSDAVGATINQLRQAFQIQKFYERQAIGGTRYIELIKSHFSVTNPDYRMQRPEYLGGVRTPININQVVQTDATSQLLGGEYVEESGVEVWKWNMSDQTPQGNTAAYSLTTGKNSDLFTHSFTEHGWVIGLAVVRTVHTYQQGLNKMFSRKSIFDFYWPEFANLGNMSILNKEIYLQGPTAINPSTGKEYDEETFGYQEAWAEYRYLPDIVTAEMRSNYSQSLDIWHWADDYSALPSLGDEWIEETKANVERTLAVQNHDQFFGDFYFNCIMTRPMPLYSVPGLIDHH